MPTYSPSTYAISPGPGEPRARGVMEDEPDEVVYHDRSHPKYQFADMILEEMDRIWRAHPKAKGRTDKHLHVNRHIRGGWLYDEARREVQAQWMEQGIWDYSWAFNGLGPLYTDAWKHEEPLPVKSTVTTRTRTTEARTRSHWLAEVRRQRDASRPVHMFQYQVANECERLTHAAKAADPDGYLAAIPADINTQAYERVRQRWENRKIWDEDWRVLPGMTWRHEKPIPFGSDSGGSDSGRSHDEGYGDMPARFKGMSLAQVAGIKLMEDKEARERGDPPQTPSRETPLMTMPPALKRKKRERGTAEKRAERVKRARVVDPKTGSVSGL
ncbi:hypothetical protein GGR53DRAFT_468495 [Hypoxylon sp. FL1150]|nr:hypothetical protein GGR53DRAFT_468495 [Hypoxylon sp. FL1150]